MATTTKDKPLRLLLVLPSWVGDIAMATPTMRRIRTALPGAFIGALLRPGMDQLLIGTDLVDELHVYQPHGVMATKKAAAKVRPRNYDTAVLFTNSFSTALITRIAFIPRRIGYDRDTRGLLLSDRIAPPKESGAFKLTPAVDYYWNLASRLLGEPELDWSIHTPTTCTELPLALPNSARLELPIGDADRAKSAEILTAAGVTGPYAVLNPGGNNPAKRWPADRFAALADHLHRANNLRVLINGSPAESDLIDDIIARAQSAPISLPKLGNTLGALKPILAGARIMVTNDTGPRHIAAAYGCPLVTLFGPTDPRWTTIPVARFPDGSPTETVLVADPTLPATESANDHPDRCAIEHITQDAVRGAVECLLNHTVDPSAN